VTQYARRVSLAAAIVLGEDREFGLPGELCHELITIERDHDVDAWHEFVGPHALRQKLAGHRDLLAL
jgi:hypothetical protein